MYRQRNASGCVPRLFVVLRLTSITSFSSFLATFADMMSGSVKKDQKFIECVHDTTTLSAKSKKIFKAKHNNDSGRSDR